MKKPAAFPFELSETDRRLDAMDYSKARAQISSMLPITFGAEIRVLILTDRLPGCARGLYEYLSNSDDITVRMVYTLKDARKAMRFRSFDFLIIVGMLEKRKNYESIQIIRRKNPNARVIMYALLDWAIRDICAEYGIECSYSRKVPMEGFISYMRQQYRKQP
ncbi:MAG: hypothetical protein LBR76_03515 [Oscillospiraceae bacterium]|jgi:DNA-binding NarL/FixJ family response regulator|nr:hypothetical protein [Oscillospiraceae bacterium]